MSSHSDDPREFTLALPAGMRVGGSYQLLHPLASASTASLLYVARDERSDAPLVVKEFLPRALASRGPDGQVRPHSQLEAREYTRALRRFALESELLRDIVHEHLVRVVDVVEGNGTAYTVMERHEGESLEAMARAQGGMLPVVQAIDMMLLVLDALDVVQAEAILHRAVSPEAILVSPEGSPRLLGFSASRHLQRAREAATPWMAIEQYGTRGLGPWTDVHACAAVLYRLITGSLPPTATERAAGESLVAPAVAVRGLSPALSMLLLSALSQSPEQRPHSAGEFRRRLEAVSRTIPRTQHAPASAEATAASRPRSPFGGVAEPASQGPRAAMAEMAAGAAPQPERVALESDDGWLVLPPEHSGRLRLVAPLRRAGSRLVAPVAALFRRLRPTSPPKVRPRALLGVLAVALTLALAAALTIWRGTLGAERVSLRSNSPPPTTAPQRPATVQLTMPAALQQGVRDNAAHDSLLLSSSISHPSHGDSIPGADVPTVRTLQPSQRDRTTAAPPARARDRATARPTETSSQTDVPRIAAKVNLGAIAIPTGGVDLRSAPPALLLALHASVDAAAQRVDDGEYAEAHRGLQAVLARTDSLLQTYVASAALTALRHDVEQADASARAACGAENELLRRRGAPVKPCG